MQFAAISDIHGNVDALEAVLADIARRGITDIVNLGDCLSGPLDAAATADRLMALDVPTIYGNHDIWLVDRPRSEMGLWETWVIDDLTDAHLDWVRAMPMTLMYTDDVMLCHATPEDFHENWLDHRGKALPRVIARDLDGVLARAKCTASLTLCGHTHVPRSIRLPDGRRVVNPGAVGIPGYRDVRSEPHMIQQTGSPDARYAILTQIDGQWTTDLIAVPYDSRRMATMARTKGADSWAQALETGWIV